MKTDAEDKYRQAEDKDGEAEDKDGEAEDKDGEAEDTSKQQPSDWVTNSLPLKDR